jgi:hypothetical protein
MFWNMIIRCELGDKPGVESVEPVKTGCIIRPGDIIGQIWTSR